MEEQITQINQRVPRWLLERLDEEATRERRSRNEQINRILEERYSIKREENEAAA